jgi:hypothetical protein
LALEQVWLSGLWHTITSELQCNIAVYPRKTSFCIIVAKKSVASILTMTKQKAHHYNKHNKRDTVAVSEVKSGCFSLSNTISKMAALISKIAMAAASHQPLLTKLPLPLSSSCSPL